MNLNLQTLEKGKPNNLARTPPMMQQNQTLWTNHGTINENPLAMPHLFWLVCFYYYFIGGNHSCKG